MNHSVLIPFGVLATLLASALAAADPSTNSGAVPLVQVEKAIIERTNQFRIDNDLPAVATDSDLTQAATKFARFMAETDKYGHGADGRSPAERAQSAGYRYCVVRENIAYRTNSADPDESSLVDVFVQGWIDSPPHRENMLADYITDTGVAVATSDGVTFYAVQMFGRPKSKSIKISVTNRSQESATLRIHSNDSEDEIDLQPLMQVRLRRCFPTNLQLAGDDGEIRIADSADVAITSEGLQREGDQAIDGSR